MRQGSAVARYGFGEAPVRQIRQLSTANLCHLTVFPMIVISLDSCIDKAWEGHASTHAVQSLHGEKAEISLGRISASVIIMLNTCLGPYSGGRKSFPGCRKWGRPDKSRAPESRADDAPRRFSRHCLSRGAPNISVERLKLFDILCQSEKKPQARRFFPRHFL